jgi:hypothetical protein
MNISYRLTRSGKWLVCEALPHTLGVGVGRVGTPTDAYTTGTQFGAYATEDAALAQVEALTKEFAYTYVPWVTPHEFNQQFIDLDLSDDAIVYIGTNKTVDLYKGQAIRNIDVTEGKWCDNDFAIVIAGGDGRRYLESTNGGYRLGDLKRAILEARRVIDEEGG